jgi:hypothetical protein
MIVSKYYSVNLHLFNHKKVNDRDKQIVALRPLISKAEVSLNTKEDEFFQNQTLRPILKQQNPLFLTLFTSHIQNHKISFFQMNEKQQNKCIANSLSQNQAFKNTMIGVVIAWFTQEETNIYCHNRTIFNKRIVQMLIQRLQDQKSLIK